MQNPGVGVSQLLRESILQLCKASVHSSEGFEIDGIVCISIGKESEQIVVKVHERISKSKVQETSEDEGNFKNGTQDNVTPSKLLKRPREEGSSEPHCSKKKKNIEKDPEVSEKSEEDQVLVEKESSDGKVIEVIGSIMHVPNKDSNTNELSDEDDEIETHVVKIEPRYDLEDPEDSLTQFAPDTNFSECYLCHLLLGSDEALHQHLKDMHEAHKCSHCDEVFPSTARLQKHVMSRHAALLQTVAPRVSSSLQGDWPNRPVLGSAGLVVAFKCAVCSVVYESERACEEHMRQVHNHDHRFLCVPCQEYFPNRSMFTSHRESSHGDQYEVLCTLCLVGFQQVEYPRHKADCRSAPIPFSVPWADLRTMLDMQAQQAESFSEETDDQDTAGSQTSKKASVLDNILPRVMANLNHSDPRPASGPSTSTATVLSPPRSLVKDEDRSSDEESATGKSQLCHNRFIQRPPAALLGPFRCTACDVLCQDISEFEQHNYCRHCRFVCLHCAQTFASRRNLRRHVRKHTGENPYSCELCGKSFYRDDDLRRHKVLIHKLLYACCYCQNYVLFDRSDLEVHLQASHPEYQLSAEEIAKHTVSEARRMSNSSL